MPSHKSFIACVLWVFLIFCAGFIIFFGKEAASSGSWKYTITHLDEFGYWAVAEGAASQPANTANPYYFENSGNASAIPYTTAVLAGKFSRLIHVPVLNLFPLWHIGMPFLIWLVTTGCICLFFNQPPVRAGLFSLAIITLTLYVRGSASFIFFRFSRPMDGLLLLIPWLCAIVQTNRLSPSKNMLLAGIPLLLVWLHPIYLLPAVVALIIESLHRAGSQDPSRFKYLPAHIFFMLTALAIFALFLRQHMEGQSNWMWELLSGKQSNAISGSLSGARPLIPFHALSVSWAILTAYFLTRKAGLKFSAIGPVERLFIALLFTDALMANGEFILGRHWQLGHHRYYFLFPLLLAEAGCLNTLIKNSRSKHLAAWSLICLFCLCITLVMPHYNIFLAGPLDTPFFYDYDPSYLILICAFLYGFILCLFYRFPEKLQTSLSARLTIPVLTALCLTGFALRPAEMHKNNHAYPYGQAYQWLAEHAAPGEVVLHVSPKRRWNQEYLIFETGLKDYYSPYFGHAFSGNESENAYRSVFYNQLLLGWLDRYPIEGISSVDDKLKHLKLNYLLAPNPTPFRNKIETQLGQRVQKVYEDSRAVLWKVTPLPESGTL